MSSGAWQGLVKAMQGRVLRPGDADYELRRRVWNGAIDRRPLTVAQCADADDVCAAVCFAVRGCR
ncbi:hypothetical protein ABQJ54_00130 [Rhodanobacter sp. Si-c]|uniref:Uncharacterized protein n=1 Tax=Rhodanobacter lycopersici TaxID=3162487 RepID=A0ABV3Q8K7_9GAMM